MPFEVTRMKRNLFALTLLVIQFAATALFAQTAATTSDVDPVTLTGPYTHDNLAVFVVHDPSAKDEGDILTLQEALKKGVVTIKETGNVNELRATNRSKSKVFLQSGDIVKGGRQDRVLQHDTMLLPKSKNVPLAAFCVEAGRWTGRGREARTHFSSSNNRLVTKAQKLAVKLKGNQGAVWDSVAKAQSDVSKHLGGSVKSAVSSTSLQLSLENKTLRGTVETYVEDIERQVPPSTDAVGYAMALNGQVESVDVFATPGLFAKLKSKLLRAGATEAIAAKTTTPFEQPKAAAVQTLVSDAESGEAKLEKQNLRTEVSKKETGKSVVFSTKEDSFHGKAAHKSYMAK
jgi:hypothetical protein